MQADRRIPSPILSRQPHFPSSSPPATSLPLLWDWGLEHEDRKREKSFDQSHMQVHIDEGGAFDVDRKAMRDIVEEKMKEPVGRIVFLSSGTFHKAYLITLSNTGRQLIFRVARRYMPKLKTLSEVATVRWLREVSNDTSDKRKGPRVKVDAPEIYDWDANPWNRVGGEWILMQKAPGVPLSQVYHSLSYHSLMKLLENLARIVIPLFGYRWQRMGSLYLSKDVPEEYVEDDAVPHTCYAPDPVHTEQGYFAGDSTPTLWGDGTPTGLPATPVVTAPPPNKLKFNFSFTPLIDASTHATASSPGLSTPLPPPLPVARAMSRTTSTIRVQPSNGTKRPKYTVGPIISWPYFGSHRGLLVHPTEINRGPFPSLNIYMRECVLREMEEVVRENEGKRKPHKLHLDPAEIRASRRHHLDFKSGREEKNDGDSDGESSDDSEWDLEESEMEWDGPGDMMYRDYRRMQRTTFLVSHLEERRQKVEAEMQRWEGVMHRLYDVLEEERKRVLDEEPGGEENEQFGLDCHDLSLENVFVDPDEPYKITAIIDWESTTTRPLWACAHLPAFLQSSPFTAKLFRQIVVKFAEGQSPSPSSSSVSSSPRNLVSKPLADEEERIPIDAALAKEWLFYEQYGARLRMAHRVVEWDGWEEGLANSILGEPEDQEETWFAPWIAHETKGSTTLDSRVETKVVIPKAINGKETTTLGALKVVANSELEMEKEMVLDTTGDICGGVGGELGRRLEAWLSTSGSLEDPGIVVANGEEEIVV